MAKYDSKAQHIIGDTLHEFKHGQLKSGKSGKPVKNRKQAVAIGISKARDKHAKVPNDSSS